MWSLGNIFTRWWWSASPAQSQSPPEDLKPNCELSFIGGPSPVSSWQPQKRSLRVIETNILRMINTEVAPKRLCPLDGVWVSSGFVGLAVWVVSCPVSSHFRTVTSQLNRLLYVCFATVGLRVIIFFVFGFLYVVFLVSFDVHLTISNPVRPCLLVL